MSEEHIKIGQILKTFRQKKKYTQEKISDKTKISIQNISSDGKYSDLTFTVAQIDLFKAKKCINRIKHDIKVKNILPDSNVAKISIVGIGMRSNAGIAEDMFKALGKQKINIDLISTSEIKISVLISRRNLKKAINVLHKTYNLG